MKFVVQCFLWPMNNFKKLCSIIFLKSVYKILDLSQKLVTGQLLPIVPVKTQVLVLCQHCNKKERVHDNLRFKICIKPAVL